MGQVPTSETAPIGIVGDGRVARHFHHYFDLLGLPVRTWSRRKPAARPVDALAMCRTILLLISDTAIVPFVREWAPWPDKQLVHFSGSLVTDLASGAHPLMSFGETLYDLATYRSIPFILNEGGPSFSVLLPQLENPSFTIPPHDRPYYHALCVMAGNFSTLLWLKLFDEFSARWGIPATAAHPYLVRTAANLLTDPDGAFTGPLTRGDAQTVAANLEALDHDPFRGVYAAFTRAYASRS